MELRAGLGTETWNIQVKKIFKKLYREAVGVLNIDRLSLNGTGELNGGPALPELLKLHPLIAQTFPPDSPPFRAGRILNIFRLVNEV